MTHPEELLAGYTDDTLTDPERGEVEAHLATCALCRDEIDLARTAFAALQTLEEEPVPFGVTGPVLAEAGKRFERRRALVWERLQWAAGLAAAAALVLVVALSLGRGGEDDLRAGAGATADVGAEVPAEAEAALGAGFAGLERQPDVNYDEAGVGSLAREAIGADAPGGQGDDTLELMAPDEALGCLRASGAPVDDPGDLLIRLIEAEYLDTPAYLAIFLEGPGADQPPTSAVVWVAAVDDCRILTIASQRL